MKLALAIAIGVLTAVWVLIGLWTTLGALKSLGDVIAECRRSWKVAVLWFVCFASIGLGFGLLAASQSPWWTALALVIAVVTFIQANQLTHPLTPSPFEALASLLRECFHPPLRAAAIIAILSLDGTGAYLLWRRFPACWAMACFLAGGVVFAAGVALSWRSWSREEKRRLARVGSMADREGEGRASSLPPGTG